MKGFEPIAITGIGCRFPGGANDPKAFWKLLQNGTDAVGEVPESRWSRKAFYDSRPGLRGRSVSKWGGFLESIERFDAGFFGISAREAAFIDPQHRLLLETAWEALEDAGEMPQEPRTGVFVGISTTDYAHIHVSQEDHDGLDIWSPTGGVASIAANRISYCLNLHGPSLAVDTACSSSLVALHLACQSLQNRECLVALAAGVNALIFPAPFISFSQGGMLSPDGRCKAFDASANGFVRAEGAGVVVLKPLKAALESSDLIYAVIAGTAVNQDGRTAGLTFPSREAQAQLLRESLKKSGIAPAEIHYVEAHGTGTAVGDPIEAAALGEVLCTGRNPATPCLIGSVKTNIGHLEAGAGLAGLIKTALSLFHREIPPSLHFKTPNPQIDFERLGLKVVTGATPYPAGPCLPAAIVNSFGFGGTNANAILQAPAGDSHQVPRSGGEPFLLALSAKTKPALASLAEKYVELLESEPTAQGAGNVAYSAGAFRIHHRCRLALTAATGAEAASKLRSWRADESGAGVSEGMAAEPAPVFVFSGQGPQWWGMGRELMRQLPGFRQFLEKCDRIYRRHVPWSLVGELSRNESESRMSETAIAQPAIFALQMALVAHWESWGIRPAAIVGHSVGEAAAATAAGILSLEEGARVIIERGRCMEKAGRSGRMLAAGLSEEDAAKWIHGLSGRVCIGSINSPASVVLSGEPAPLESLAEQMESSGIFIRWLPGNYAFHSHLMDPAREELLGALGRIALAQARVPILSTVTGIEAGGSDFQAEYWWRNVRQPVQFARGIDDLIGRGFRTFLEIGPHPVLSASITECLAARSCQGIALASLRRKNPEYLTLLESLGALYVQGSMPRWKALQPEARRVRLPTYAWQREEYWLESPLWEHARKQAPSHPLLARRKDGASPVWQSTLDLEAMPFLQDHVVNGQIVFPAAGFIDVALAASSRDGSHFGALEDVSFLRMLPLAEEWNPLQLELALSSEEQTFSISTSPGHARGEWTLHVTGQMPAPQKERPAAVDLESSKARCQQEISGELVYEAFRRCGLRFGPAFRGIQRVWRRDGEAWGEIFLPEEQEEGGHHIHPAVLDSCLQVLSQALPFKRGTQDALYLPVRMGSVNVYGKIGTSVWSRAVLVEETPDAIRGNIDIFDQDGGHLLQILDFECRAASRNPALDRLEDDYYEREWQELEPREHDGLLRNPGKPGTWMIFADRGGLGEKLAAHLSADGQKAWTVYPGKESRVVGESCREISPDSPQDFLEVLEAAREATGLPLAGVIHLWNLDLFDQSPSFDLLKISESLGVFSLVSLARALLQHGLAEPAGIHVVTRGSLTVHAGDRCCFFQSGAPGILRVMRTEFPKFRSRLIDLDPASTGGDLDALVREIELTDTQEEVAWRAWKRHGWILKKQPFSEALQKHALTGAAGANGFRMEFGNHRELVARPTTRVAPGDGEVEVEVQAVGVNFRDVMKSLGIYPGGSDPLPGDEFAGRIVAIGTGVTGFQTGDPVLAMEEGAFCSHLTLPAARLARIPSGISLREAATLPVAFLTAWYALVHLARLRQGEKVLIHAGAGGVGLAAIQVAKYLGAEIFATAGSPEKRAFLKEIGVPHVMDSRSLSFSREVLSLTGGRGADVVLNSLSGQAIMKGLECLAPGGRFLEIGKRDIYRNTKLGLLPFRRNISFFAIDLAQISKESPHLVHSLLLDVLQRVEKGDLRPLPFEVIPMSRATEAFSRMARALHKGKMVLEIDQPSAPPAAAPLQVALREDATYLITGGLGGVGMEVVEWLLRSGAKHLVLVGRSKPGGKPVLDALSRYQSLGANILVLQADVSREDDVRSVFDRMARGMPPLRGVIHLAMQIEDKTMERLERGSFQRVLASKAEGAWWLHQFSEGMPLEFFVLFSSAVALLGSAGQASYAAANSYLDGLAAYRRGRGLPALSVNWGLLEKVGYVSRNPALEAALQNSGLVGIPPEDVTAALGWLMGSSISQAAILRMNWQAAAKSHPLLATSPRFRELVPSAATSSRQPFKEKLECLPEHEKQAVILAELREQVALVIRSSSGEVNDQTPLTDLGLDSLLSVELLNRLENRLQITIPLGTIHPAASPMQIAAKICHLMGVSVEASSPRPAIPPVVPAPATIERAAGEAWDEQDFPGQTSVPLVQHRIEAFALRILVTWLRAGSLDTARGRLRRLLPLLKVCLRRDLLWAHQNLRLVYGNNLSSRERGLLASTAFENHLWSYLEGLRNAEMECDFIDPDNLLKTYAAGRGAVLCGIHLGTWEPILRWGPAAGVPVVGVYRPAQNPLSNAIFQEIRSTYGIEWIPSNQPQLIVKALEQKKVVGLMSDLNTLSGGIEAEFLGVPALGPAGPAKLAIGKNVPIIPAFAVRTGRNRGTVRFLPPISPEGESPATLARRVNSVFEPWILEFADQYNWLHPRWRTRPDGTAWTLATSMEELISARTGPCYLPAQRIRSLLSQPGITSSTR